MALLALGVAIGAVVAATPRPAGACSGDAFEAFARADVVVVGEIVAVSNGPGAQQDTSFMRLDVARYLKGRGPAQLETSEPNLSMCSSGIGSESVGRTAILGLMRESGGRWTVPHFATAWAEDADALQVFLREHGSVPPEGTGILVPRTRTRSDFLAQGAALLVVLLAAGVVRHEVGVRMKRAVA